MTIKENVEIQNVKNRNNITFWAPSWRVEKKLGKRMLVTQKPRF